MKYNEKCFLIQPVTVKIYSEIKVLLFLDMVYLGNKGGMDHSQGSHGSWKVLNLEFSKFRTWKVMKLAVVLKKSWKCWIWLVPSWKTQVLTVWGGRPRRKMLNWNLSMTSWRQLAWNCRTVKLCRFYFTEPESWTWVLLTTCLLYTSDAADE